MDISGVQIETSSEQVFMQMWWKRAMDPTATPDSLHAMLCDPNAPQNAEWQSFVLALIKLLEWVKSGSWPANAQEVLRVLVKWEEEQTPQLLANLAEIATRTPKGPAKAPENLRFRTGLGC